MNVQKVGGSLLGRLANMEMWPQPENIILQLLLFFLILSLFFRLTPTTITMFQCLISSSFSLLLLREKVLKTISECHQSKKKLSTQYVLIIIIHFYKGSKSGIRKYVKIENTAKCVEQEEG